MIKSRQEAERLARKYEIPTEDIVLISLNLSGIKAEIPDKRIRFKLKLNSSSEVFYFAICVNTTATPFEYKDSKIYLKGEEIATVFEPEKDTCDDNYFRRERTELTLNSNSRSSCRGCKFCETYNQGANDLERLWNRDLVEERIKQILQENDLKDITDLFRVTICTGCFGTEIGALEHLLMVNKVLKTLGFQGLLRYIGSEIVSEGALDIIKEEIGKFALSFTAEVFTRRNELLKETKSKVTLDHIKEILFLSLKRGFYTNILYILGLDPLEISITTFSKFAPYMNRIPIINLMQNYLPEQEGLKDPQARNIEYYLKARKGLEKIFKPTGLRPNSWENYRPLWYFSFAGEKLNEIRI